VLDLETKRLGANEKGEQEYDPNVICVTHRCFQCKDLNGESYKCSVCGDSSGNSNFVFYTMKPFINHVLEKGPKVTQVVALAHNAHGLICLLLASCYNVKN